MKKTIKIFSIVVTFVLLAWVLIYFGKKNSQSAIDFKVKEPFITSIEKKSVITGKIIPENEVAIKPQISGIIQQIYLEEGDNVKSGDLIAKIKVVPNEQSLNSAKGRIKNARIKLDNATIEYKRNKALFEKGVIASQNFNTYKLNFNQAKQDFSNAKSDFQIIKGGSAEGVSTTNTSIRATVSGTILEIPVKKGDQVIESNTFNAGTTIASIADLNKMIFEGKVDEAEVSKLEKDRILDITIGAFEGIHYKAKLNFIAPKGTEEEGAVLFKIKATMILEDVGSLRAGYSANAELVLDKKTAVLAIKESLVQYDRKTEKPFVEIQTEEQVFKRKDVKLGISDGINIEVISGVTKEDKIKVWNKASKEDEDDEDDEESDD